MEGNSFLQKKKEDFYSIQKNQLDNFKMITTQTNILFELLNQKFLKQINKIRFKTIIIIIFNSNYKLNIKGSIKILTKIPKVSKLR